MSSVPRRSALDWFEALCDLAPEAAMEALGEVPADVREVVRAMLAADREDDDVELDPSAVYWNLASELAAETPADPTHGPPEITGYDIVGPLGSGGMGWVYEAEQHEPRRRVAIKVLRASGPEARQAAMVEAQALADVQHPTIPRVLEVGAAGPFAFLVMDLIQGETLTTWGQGRPLEARLQVMVSLCRGVQAAHDAGVLHRDLKPANILIAETAQPCIVDFGLAGSRDADGQVTGTLAYLSDERLAGAPASVASDVHALGVTLYELVTGRRPWPDASVPSLRAAARCRKNAVTPPSARGIGDADLDAIVARALAPEATRYASVRGLADDLSAWLQHRPVSARPASALRRGRMWIRRNPGLVAAVALTAILVSTAGGSVVAGARWSEQRRVQQAERRAQERLHALQEALAPTYDQGGERAHESVQFFASDPSIRGTSAERAAWLWHHEQLVATGQRHLARAALTRAWLVSRDHPERREVRMAIARTLHDEGRWYPLLVALGDADDPEARSLRTRAAIATRQLDHAQLEPALQPLLHALRQARRTPHRPISVTPLAHSDPPLLAIVDQSADRLTLAHRDVTLDVARTLTLPEVVYGFENPAVVDDDPPWLLGRPRDHPERLNVWRIREDFALEGTVPSAAPLGGWTSADTDGDGTLELYYGTPYPERAVWTLRVGASGWQRLPMVATGRDHASDVEVVRTLDLDRDGDDEVLVSSGLWRAFDLRVADRRGGRLQWTDRVRLGGTPAVAVTDDPEPWVVTAAGNSVDIGASGARPPEGVRTYRFDGDGRLVLEHAIPFPLPRPYGASAVVLGDLDGDGRDEVLVTVETDTHQTWLVRFGPDGEATSLLLHGLLPLAATQLDGDPADELLVRLVDDDHHMWVLGAGDETLPAWRPGEPTSPTSTDPLDELLLMGFGVETAEVLSAADDHARAADLLAQQERWSDAVTQYDQAIAAAGEAERARLVERRTRAARAGHLLEAPTWTGDLARTLPPALEIHRPGRLRWRSTTGGLQMDGIAADGVLAELPLVVTDPEQIGMWASLQVDELEPGARLDLQLVGADDRVVLATSVGAWGGNRQVDRTGTCRGPSATDTLLDIGGMLPIVDHRTHHTQRAHLSGDEVLCELRRNGAFRSQGAFRVSDVPAGPHRLRILATSETPREDAARFVATLSEIRLWGLRPAPPSEGGEHRAHLAWVTGDLDAALQWYGQEAPVPLLLAVGRTREAAAGIARLDRRELLAGLKRQPATWLPLVWQGMPERFASLYRDAWLPGVAGHRSESVLATLDHPFVDELAPTDDLVPFLFHRAVLIADEGEVHRAGLLLERLLSVARDAWVVDVHLALARIVVHDEPARARQHCDEARAADRWFIAEDGIADDPALRRVCD